MTIIAARFTQGEIAPHIMKMALTNMVSLSVFFCVDLITIYFVSLLNHAHLVAAIGYASAILFFTHSLTIAFMIAISAVVGNDIGQGKFHSAKKVTTTALLLSLTLSLIISLFIYCFSSFLLSMIGATGEALAAATVYLKYTVLAFPMIALALSINAVLRVLGKAKTAMLLTVFAGLVNVLLDLLFIFYYQWEINGAAYAIVISRAIMLLLGLYYLLSRYQFVVRLNWAQGKYYATKLARILMAATTTQLITPLSHLYITYEIAKFGAESIAAWVIISRLIPVIFVMLFAMPGAIGPIISQNLGAKQLLRVKHTLNYALNFIIKYVLVAALMVSFLQDELVTLFNAHAETATLIRFFCQYITLSFLFVAINLVCMSFLNNVGHSSLATRLNIYKILFGVIPLVSVGAYYGGSVGILIGQALGNALFALIALVTCYRILFRLNIDE